MTLYKLFTSLSVSIFVCLAVFYAFLPMNTRIVLCFVLLFLAFGSVKRSKGLNNRRDNIDFYYPWLLFSIFILTGISSSKPMTVFMITCICFPLLMSAKTEWIKSTFYIVGFVTGVNVLATYYFLLFPAKYSKMIEIYGYIPSGTSRGQAGYRAGIANHYSQNGIYISICLIFIVIMYACIYGDKKNKKHKMLYSLIITATFFSQVLTGKRAVLIFVFGSFIISYILMSKKKLNNIVKISLFVFVMLLITQFLSEMVPQIAYLIERFNNIGDDTGSLERLAMWKLAIDKFKHSPIIGNGFWSFKDYYQQNLADIWHPGIERYQRLNAHNVYLQVLCETGIVGFVIYVAAITSVLKRTIVLIRHTNIEDLYCRYGIIVSFCIQVFYLLYSVTGNCLYDVVFYFYSLAVAMTMSINKRILENE